jgi:peptidoglycan/xylan/chitin deacetylase (PgdA/CDA1 family)
MRAILTYHSIDDSGSPISCARAAFERHVAWLASGRVRVTTLDALAAVPAEIDAVALTFDDAFLNFGDIAAPRLLAHGLPATVFAVTDAVGTTNAWGGIAPRTVPHLPLLGWDALGALSARGVRVGSHTRTHRDLTGASDHALADELGGSADALQAALGLRPDTFAYPYGYVDDRVAAAAAATYAYACTTEFRVIDGPVQPAWLPRLDAYYLQQPGTLDLWGTPAFDRFVRRRHALRRLRRGPGAIVRRALSGARA